MKEMKHLSHIKLKVRNPELKSDPSGLTEKQKRPGSHRRWVPARSCPPFCGFGQDAVLTEREMSGDGEDTDYRPPAFISRPWRRDDGRTGRKAAAGPGAGRLRTVSVRLSSVRSDARARMQGGCVEELAMGPSRDRLLDT